MCAHCCEPQWVASARHTHTLTHSGTQCSAKSFLCACVRLAPGEKSGGRFDLLAATDVLFIRHYLHANKISSVLWECEIGAARLWWIGLLFDTFLCLQLAYFFVKYFLFVSYSALYRWEILFNLEFINFSIQADTRSVKKRVFFFSICSRIIIVLVYCFSPYVVAYYIQKICHS